MTSFKNRLRSGSMLADPKFNSPTPVVPQRDSGYGIEREGDEIVVMLGPIPPFRLPVAAAEKMALLMLKKCKEGSDVQETSEKQAGRTSIN